MTNAYPEWDYNGSDVVPHIATKLYTARKTTCRVSPLILMTDPTRIPDIIKTIQNMPPKSTIIYRHFGKADKYQEAQTLRQITFQRSQQLLIGADPELAISIGADGVHFRRNTELKDPTLWRKRCPDWVITMAGLKQGNYSSDLSFLDALIISSVFNSQSRSAGQPIGINAFQALVKMLPLPVFALGGINPQTAPKLINSGAAGLAGIGYSTLKT